MTPSPLCCESDAGRRSLVREGALNGFDYIEVDCLQTTLTVTFLGHAPAWITPAHLRIEGGRRERNIRILDVRIEPSGAEDIDDVMHLTVDRPGDFSNYRLVILNLDERGRPTGRPPPQFDVRYASIEFSFKAGCPVEQDPIDAVGCPQVVAPEPAIDYLAKDYQGFRRLLLDRLALTMPDWTERHLPDLGIALVEILSYVADDLSYYQDAVATEAFLDTARLRESVRRHLRLVDYRLGEGRSAQTWARITLEGAPTIALGAGDLMFTPALPGVGGPMHRAEGIEIDASVIVFEPAAEVGRIQLYSAHNTIPFYDWDEAECCLPIGAVTATLVDPGVIPEPAPNDEGNRDCEPDPPPLDVEAAVADGRWHKLALAVGDVLIFAEVIGPRTGDPADADPMHQHAVRLTSVRHGWDPLHRQLVVEIEWCPEDALPFPLCLSTTTGPPRCTYVSGVSVAYGNIIAVDHGRSLEADLGRVGTARIEATCAEPCAPPETVIVPKRFRPRLPPPGLTFVGGAVRRADNCGGCGALAASLRGRGSSEGAIPAITLTSEIPGGPDGIRRHWRPRPDLLDSGPDDSHFVVEISDDAAAILRFGDNRHGLLPEAGEHFTASYRVGNGLAGNIGAHALALILFRNAYPDGVTLTVSNPLPARGGAAAESAAAAKLRAPHQFRRRLARAITADDYAAIVMRDFGGTVQRAAASLRSTGVRTEVQVAIDPHGRAEADARLLDCIARHLELYRRVGHDVRVIQAAQVPIDLAVKVCVGAEQIAERVRFAVVEALGTRPGGFFSPDALTFGGAVSVSRIMAAVHAVEGVTHVEVTVLNRLNERPDGELAAGLLPIGPLEVPRLDQDPDAPENGRLKLTMGGGR